MNVTIAASQMQAKLPARVKVDKISKILIAPFLSYSIFLRGLFFMPHPVLLNPLVTEFH